MGGGRGRGKGDITKDLQGKFSKNLAYPLPWFFNLVHLWLVLCHEVKNCLPFFQVTIQLATARLYLKKITVALDRGSVDQISLDQISWSNFSIKRLKSCHLIESFINDSINCQKRTYGFWHLIKILIMSFWVILNFWSSAKKELMDFGSWSKLFKLI